ncbi:hypothetical protein F7725_005872 [Dissostichus mawsoni]|uniref:tRNA-binding domain-containing protein n=1 Tax=Dissostichus mawsoni TaxID=36200 RepID=A0A7J5YVJ1_DISMA|nr:hypothetical protein F7725_005872 [Dissostichus mawsoni]
MADDVKAENDITDADCDDIIGNDIIGNVMQNAMTSSVTSQSLSRKFANRPPRSSTEFTFFDDAKQTQTSRSPCAQTQETSEVPRCSQTQESGPTQTLSNDRKHMQNRMAVVLCNLKPAKRRGVLSQAAVLCARSPDRVEILDPEQNQGTESRSRASQVTRTRADPQTEGVGADSGIPVYRRGAAFEIGKGVCKAQSMSISEIKQTIRAAPKKLSANPCRQTSHNML